MIDNLLSNWATPKVANWFQIVGKDAPGKRTASCAVFVATLWSGKSQLAFRKLVSHLDSLDAIDRDFYLIDSEEETEFDEFKTFDTTGSGLLLRIDDGVLVSHLAGEDLASDQKIASFVEGLRPTGANDVTEAND